jgi:hypothetical protein
MKGYISASHSRRSPNLALTSSGVCGPISIGLGSPMTGVLATALLELAAASLALMCRLLRPIIDFDRDDKDMDGVVKASTADEEDRAATVAATGSRAVIGSFIAFEEFYRFYLKREVDCGWIQRLISEGGNEIIK